MKKTDYFSLRFDQNQIIYLDQTKLPLQEIYVETSDYEKIAVAIETLGLRGAPLIGISAAYALALSIKGKLENRDETFYKAYNRLLSTRPTAVNLFFALNEIKSVYEKNKNTPNIYEILLKKAIELHSQDEEYCRKIGENGLAVFNRPSNVLTHCNTGKLATGGEGTAFNVIRTGFEHGLIRKVFVDETRPLLQGLRLTAYELKKNNIPFSVQPDSAAGSLFSLGEVDLVITGADRIALNGDSANKVGTLNLGVLANYYNVPFYIAAPSTTIDRNIASGADIVIEHRGKSEVLHFNGTAAAPAEYETFSPAFDVTPSHLITGIITDKKVYKFPYNFLYE